ncbi:hypothetical protein [Corynebacterium aquilae]|uniref:Uncharacterized protein n=1 Tax=Corynebacterium aquilae DSM 44791 TaxID=1431546 RepID=A0A1L7CE69_9CORY|nr:hypothetical protein [Corynebacterium aquilae]APT84170.1 hypothetical protein CAQU_02770 [Corynebacterium aquilae DSM 44791]
MAALGLIPGELVYADLTTPLSRLAFPLTQAMLATGITGIAIGFIDAQWLNGNTGLLVDYGPLLRTTLLVIWALFILIKLILPAIGSRRRRIIVTDQRLILRAPGLRGSVTSVELEQILGAQRQGSTISIRILGARRPLIIDKAPKAKKLTHTINELAAYNRATVPYLSGR